MKVSASTIQKLNDFQTLPSDCYEFSTSRLPVRIPGLCREQPVGDRHRLWTLLMDDCALVASPSGTTTLGAVTILMKNILG
ncbi:hypothetical protein LMTR3_20575 [Bradyrhizobium sp. LMTR 3]|nr:hypothetical protein LMTR3_20575 [Bradyrhizobium sp. LMTR 3]